MCIVMNDSTTLMQEDRTEGRRKGCRKTEREMKERIGMQEDRTEGRGKRDWAAV
jgi:hypothetical protein